MKRTKKGADIAVENAFVAVVDYYIDPVIPVILKLQACLLSTAQYKIHFLYLKRKMYYDKKEQEISYLFRNYY
jgi:hypothetical protein